MEINEKLQSLINNSDLIVAVNSAKELMNITSRPLLLDEIELLKKNGNRSDNWENIRVVGDFNGEYIRDNYFYGKVVLHEFTGALVKLRNYSSFTSGIYRSAIGNCIIGKDSLIYECKLLDNFIVSSGAIIFNVGTIASKERNSFGNGEIIPIGPETGDLAFPIFAEMDMEAAIFILNSSHSPGTFSEYVALYRNLLSLEKGFIGENASIINTLSIEDSFIGDYAIVDGAIRISNSTVLSSMDEPSSLIDGVLAEGALIQNGCHIKKGAVLFNSLLMEHCEVENQCRVSSSVIGPNSALGGGEVTSTFAGPFTVSHHQSLLISAIWPEGKGNIGYGANVGSNHTSRLPDQEIYPGEGLFFGLGCSIKFPSCYRKSPYSIIATGTVTQPQRVEFPFSLIIPNSYGERDIPQSFNELIPAWVLKENMFSIVRNESKYKMRNKSRRNKIVYKIFRQDIINLMIDARERLKNVKSIREFYCGDDIPGSGKNVIREESRLGAIATYDFYIRYYTLYCLYQRLCELLQRGKSLDELYTPTENYEWNHALGLLQSNKHNFSTLKSDLRELIACLEKIQSGIFNSRLKDFERGNKIIEGYERYHKPPSHEMFIIEFKETTKSLITSIEDVILKL